jgi:hypothetical protein
MSNNTQSQENYPCPGLGNNTAVQSMFISLDLDVIGYVLRIIKDRDVFQALACKRFYDALVSTGCIDVFKGQKLLQLKFS